MIGRLKIGLLAVALLLLGSCDTIHDSLDDCGIYLRFVYDYNMEYTCSFKTHVGTVDVYVFDSNGKFLFSRHADCPSQLIGGNRMYLNQELKPGEYKILTVGGLCDKFCFSDASGSDCTPGVSTIEEMRLALTRQSAEVTHEFPALWYGETIVVSYPGLSREYTVSLIKNTNQFNLALYRQDDPETNGTRASLSPLYTFEIITPEGAVYGHDNLPLLDETVKYTPYLLKAGETSNSYSVGQINTVRLLEPKTPRDNDSGYRLVVRNRETLKDVWNIDLLEILRELKSTVSAPDGSPLGMQEYLDRKSVWDIAILHRGGGPGDQHDMFTAVAIKIGPWIKWFHDMPME